jgi:hypothetical protein
VQGGCAAAFVWNVGRGGRGSRGGRAEEVRKGKQREGKQREGKQSRMVLVIGNLYQKCP